MEVVIDGQVVVADVFEERSDVVISEVLEVLLGGRGGTLMRTARILQLAAPWISASR